MRNVERQIRQTLRFARAYPEEHPRSGVQELPEARTAAPRRAARRHRRRRCLSPSRSLVPAISAKLEEKGSIKLRVTQTGKGIRERAYYTELVLAATWMRPVYSSNDEGKCRGIYTYTYICICIYRYVFRREKRRPFPRKVQYGRSGISNNAEFGWETNE